MPTPKHVYVENLLEMLSQFVSQREWHSVRNISKDLIKVDPENSEARKYLIEAEQALRSARYIAKSKDRIDALPAGTVFYLFGSLFGAGAFFILSALTDGTIQSWSIIAGICLTFASLFQGSKLWAAWKETGGTGLMGRRDHNHLCTDCMTNWEDDEPLCPGEVRYMCDSCWLDALATSATRDYEPYRTGRRDDPNRPHL